MKRLAILLSDVIAALVALEWARRGPWDRMLGFAVYHSRGDVWLPTPPAAAAFFRSMVVAGVACLVIFFLLVSLLIFFLGHSRAADASDPPRGILASIFYGDPLHLAVKYFAILFISFISPFFYHYMWRFAVSHAQRIAGGAAISIALFVALLALGQLGARASSQPRPS